MSQYSPLDPPAGEEINMNIYRTYSVWRLCDITMACGTIVLGICYIIALKLGHVHGWTDISGLVIHLPERILFRMNFFDLWWPAGCIGNAHPRRGCGQSWR